LDAPALRRPAAACRGSPDRGTLARLCSSPATPDLSYSARPVHRRAVRDALRGGVLRVPHPARAGSSRTGMTASFVVLMPVFDDWPLIPPLLARLDAALASAGLRAEVVLADDGSTVTPDRSLLEGARFRAIASVAILRLGRNAGHQRALAIGLAHI